MADGNIPPAPSSNPVAVVRRLLPATPETVYDEWIDPDALSDWMCPRPARCLGVALEPWPGGSLRFDIDDSGVMFFVVGKFLVMDRPHLLSFTWSCSTWPDPSVGSIVTVSLEANGDDETLMTIEHSLLPADLVDSHQHGWALISQQLETELERSLRGS